MLFKNVQDIFYVFNSVVSTHLHVIHHELIAQLGSVLCIRHLFVHQAVKDCEAAVRAERLNLIYFIGKDIRT